MVQLASAAHRHAGDGHRSRGLGAEGRHPLRQRRRGLAAGLRENHAAKGQRVEEELQPPRLEELLHWKQSFAAAGPEKVLNYRKN